MRAVLRLTRSRGLKSLLAHDGLIAFAIYLAIAAMLDRFAIAHMGSVCACGVPGDPAQYTWAFVWFPHALFNGLNLLHSNAMWAPTGINLAGATAVPLLAFLLAPITWLWGPIVAYNVVTIAAPVTTGWCAYRLCRYITRAPWASILAGVGFAFSSFETMQLKGHLHLSVSLCIPLAVLCVLKLLSGDLSRPRFVLLMTVILVAQMFISSEVFFTLSVMIVVGLALAWILGDSGQRQAVRTGLPMIALAYLITLVLSSYYVYELLKAPAYSTYQGYRLPTDLLSFFVPMPWTWIGGVRFAPVTSLFVYQPETLAYVGVPMLIVLARFISTRWAEYRTKLLTALLVLTTLWILGPYLFVAGQRTIYLPYDLFARLPGFREVLQGRTAVYLDLMCAVILAIWVAEARTHRWMRWCLGLVAVAFVLPNLITPGSGLVSTWTNPNFFTTNMYKQHLRRGETVLPISWSFESEALMWQAEDHMYYDMASGYFTTRPPKGWRGRIVSDLWRDVPDPRLGRQFKALLVKRDVSDVVVQASEVARWTSTLSAAGLKPTFTGGGVTVYAVPAAWRRANAPAM
jgi:hypothetical protein